MKPIIAPVMMLGDCIEKMKDIPSGSVDMILTHECSVIK